MTSHHASGRPVGDPAANLLAAARAAAARSAGSGAVPVVVDRDSLGDVFSMDRAAPKRGVVGKGASV